MLIRPANSADLEEVRRLNESVLPHVNSIPISDFEEFMRISSFFVVVEKESQIGAFLIVLGPGQSYESENYTFFSKTYESFDYVDRIVVGDQYQGNGVGKALYQYLIDHSNEDRITCEVNLDPPNPGSILFHQKMGFKEVGKQHSEGGKKWVSLMSRDKVAG
jgi:predicted GNAT superfamily acetyltransferase